MYFPLFLQAMLIVAGVFAVTAFFVTQSVMTTLFYTIVLAALIQVGYFAAVLFLIWREHIRQRRRQNTRSVAPDRASQKEV